MHYQFVQESFETIGERWNDVQSSAAASQPFYSLSWSRVWWRHFGSDSRLCLAAIVKDNDTIGIAPLRIDNDSARFIGSPDVCDYLDFVVKSGEETNFFTFLLKKLTEMGIKNLNLTPVREDSTVITSLLKIAQDLNLNTALDKEDVSLDLILPSSWEDYLKLLESKQRHELKRKMRRLSEMGEINFRTSTDANMTEIDTFIRFFRESREEKSAFLTSIMESFLRELTGAMAQNQMLRLNFLDLNAIPVAATICFDYQDIVYLYNSGYDPEYNWLSVGLISKALTIKDSINRNKKRFDFLKGNEEYKYHLGGTRLQLYRCSISLS